MQTTRTGKNNSISWTVFLKNIPGKNIYFFFGTDHYLHQLLLNAVKNKYSLSLPDFNFKIFSGNNVSMLLTSLAEIPVMDDKKIVYIKDIEKFKNSDMDKLILGLKNIDETTVVVISHYDRKPQVFQKFNSFIDSFGLSVNLTLYESDFISYAAEYFKKNNIGVDRDVISLLWANSSQDLLFLINEMDKLISYKNLQGKIVRDDVLKVGVRIIDSKIYEIMKYISKRDQKSAMSLVEDISLSGEPLAVFGYFISQYVLMYKVRAFIDSAGKYSERDV